MNSLNYDLEQSIKTERILLSILGLYPQQRHKNRPVQELTMKFCLLVCCTQQVSMTAHIIVVGTDVAKLSDILFYFAAHTAFLIKLFIFLFIRKQNYFDIENHLINTIKLHDYGAVEAKMIKRRVDDCARISNFFRFLSICTLFVVPFIPYLDESKKGKLPLPGYVPFDIAKYYYPLIAFQQIAICFCAYINITIDSLAWKLSADVAGLFDILKEKLYRYEFKQATSEGNFISYVELHYDTLILKSQIQLVFSEGIFSQFFASVINLCFTLFQLMIVVPFPSIQFMFLFGYLFCMMIEIIFFCWFGNEVMVSSDEIGKFFFMSRWHDADRETRKIMGIILERVKKPVIIMAQGIFPLSLATLIYILRSSGSYLVALKQLYDK